MNKNINMRLVFRKSSVFIFLFLMTLFSSALKAESLISTLSNVDLWKKTNNKEDIEKIVKKVEVEVAKPDEKDVLDFCNVSKLEKSTLQGVLSLGELIEFQKERLRSFNACYKALDNLYVGESQSESDKQNLSNFDSAHSRLKLLIENNSQTIGNSENLYISVSKVMPAMDISKVGPGVRIDLKDYFTLHSAKEDGKTINLPLDFTFEGCTLAKDEGDLTELDRVKRRLEEVKIILSSGSSLICILDEKQFLAIKANALGSGKQNVIVTASYVENDVVLVKRSQNFSVNLLEDAPMNGPSDCVSWSCSNHFDFLVGAEGSSMSEVKKESILRYEFASYTQIVHNHFHMFGRIYQTSVSSLQEKPSAIAGFDCNTATGDAIDANCETSLTESINADIGANLFVLKSDADANNKVDGWKFDEEATTTSLLIGPSFQYGIERADDNVDSFSKNYFSGARFAYSKLRYFDFLYGKREGMIGKRLKFKGQLPVMQDNFVAGVEVEMAADNELKDAGLSNQDSVKAFVLYQVDFAKFIE